LASDEEVLMAGKSNDPQSRSQKARDAAYVSAAARRKKREEVDLFEAAGRIALKAPSATPELRQALRAALLPVLSEEQTLPVLSEEQTRPLAS
jgi:hypothetical protein